MRNLLIGASAMVLLIACSSSSTEEPPGFSGSATGGESAVGGGSGVLGGSGGGANMGTGGASTGTGGATVSTGGTTTANTGGTTANTGGTTTANTGGTTTANTGGTTTANTGGTTTANTGGTTTVSTGGTTTANTGGTTTVSTGGTTTANTGGTDEEETGGTDSGDDDDTSTGGTVEQGDPTEFTIADGAHLTSASGNLQGYGWASADTASAIAPDTFEGVAAADVDLCFSGTVAATDDYSGNAMFGVNTNQAPEDDTFDGIEITGPITITYTNSGGSPLRIQIQDDTDSDAGRWCTDLSGDGGTETISLGDFQTTCWSTGDVYNGEDIVAIVVLVPGGNTDDVEFDFCITGIDF